MRYKRKDTKQRVSYMFKVAVTFAFFMMISVFSIAKPMTANAAGIDFNAKIGELQAKFPNGTYWNHVGMNTDNSDGYTYSPCVLHKTDGVDHVYGTNGCTCNHFVNANHGGQTTQCMGFAYKLGYDVFGDTTWTVVNNPTAAQIADIRVGDIVRLSIGHSVFVISRVGDTITVGEANYPNSCIISWGRAVTLSTTTVSYYERANNYDAIISGTETPVVNPAPEQPTSEQSSAETPVDTTFTGWKQAADGIHFVYYKAGALQKSKWLTLDKNKYYVDANGYRATGFATISKVKYYFNDNGVLQKKKWLTVDGNYYYVNENGYVLLSQWLYKGNTLVYVKADGAVAKKELYKIGSKTYYFNSTGKRSKGFKKVDGKYYYCNSSGVIQKKKWITKGGKKYYLQKNGVRVQSKLIKIGKYKYYFNDSGQLVKNKKITYGTTIYKADKLGHCKKVGTVEDTDL